MKNILTLAICALWMLAAVSCSKGDEAIIGSGEGGGETVRPEITQPTESEKMISEGESLTLKLTPSIISNYRWSYDGNYLELSETELGELVFTAIKSEVEKPTILKLEVTKNDGSVKSSFYITIAPSQGYEEKIGEDGAITWEIYNEKGLNNFADEVNGAVNGYSLANKNNNLNAKLMDDITLTPPASNGSNWFPIGHRNNITSISITPNEANTLPYLGTFDGNEKSIIGLVINRPNEKYQGLFGYTGSGSIIKDITLVNPRITSHSWSAGIASCAANDAKLISCYIVGTDADNPATIEGYSHIGGIVGYLANAKLTNCHTSGQHINIRGKSNIGGLIGTTGYNIEVLACSNSATVYGDAGVVGGLIGMMYYALDYDDRAIVGCFNAGDVHNIRDNTNSYYYKDDYTGGLAGRCHNDLGLKATYVSGGIYVDSSDERVGAFVGDGDTLSGVSGETYYPLTINRDYDTNDGSTLAWHNTLFWYNTDGLEKRWIPNSNTTSIGSTHRSLFDLNRSLSTLNEGLYKFCSENENDDFWYEGGKLSYGFVDGSEYGTGPKIRANVDYIP